MTRKVTHQVDYSTVAELRAALAGMPEDATVRVRTRFGANADGAQIKRITITSES